MSAKANEDHRTKAELLEGIDQLRARLDEAEQTLDAIRSGEVDALVVAGPHGDRVFSLTGAERTYRLIVETMNEAALTVALDETILFCNQRFCDLMKTPMADALGKKLTAFVASAQQHPLRMLLANVQVGPAQRRITLQAADGTAVSVLVAASLLVADASTSICLVASDLTELETQASSIQGLREQQQALEESRAELETANSALHASRLAALNVAEDAISARRQAEEMNAELQREVTERKQAEEELQRSEANLKVAYFQLQTANEELQVQSEELQSQNQELVRLCEKSRRDEEMLKKLNDELENRVAERTADLREKDQILLMQSRQAAMGEMINNIAHQWRQPLNTLGLVVQQLTLIDDLSDLTRELLDECVNDSMELIQHMSKTIDDFRNFFSPDKEMIEFKVSEAIANTLSLLEGTLQNPKISIEIIEKDKPVINGYQNEFIQVLINILNNAKDALVEKKIDDPRVSISIFSEDGSAVVTIADNAGGIPEEILNKIFDPYFSTKGPEQGTGIGLFMSKAIIEKNLGGQLSVRNINNGAEFRIEVCNNSQHK